MSEMTKAIERHTRAITAQIEAMGMAAENAHRTSCGNSIAYSDDAFVALLERHGLAIADPADDPGPPWLSDAAEALGEVRPIDGAPLALNWTQVLEGIRKLRDDRDRWAEHVAKSSGFVDVVFDGPPGHESGRFVEVENEHGASISFGDWVHRPDGFWALRIPR